MMLKSGLWQTSGGSKLFLNVDGNNLTGWYSTIHGQPTPGEKYPLVGMANGELCGFVVSWGEHASLTSWCGRVGYDGDKLCLRTIWHLARSYADAAHTISHDYWETFHTYTGTYYYVAEGENA